MKIRTGFCVTILSFFQDSSEIKYISVNEVVTNTNLHFLFIILFFFLTFLYSMIILNSYAQVVTWARSFILNECYKSFTICLVKPSLAEQHTRHNSQNQSVTSE